MGVLKPFLSDPYIEDITCDGVGPIFVEHKIFSGLKSVIGFTNTPEPRHLPHQRGRADQTADHLHNPVVDVTDPDCSLLPAIQAPFAPAKVLA